MVNVGGSPNPRGKIKQTLDGRTPIDQQSESLILKYTGLKFLVENPKAPFVWFAIGMILILSIEGF